MGIGIYFSHPFLTGPIVKPFWLAKTGQAVVQPFLLPAFAILLVVPITPVVIVASASTIIAGVSPPRAIIVFFFLLSRMACASLLPLMFFKLFFKSSSLGSGICRWRRERGNRPGRVCALFSATPHFTAQRVNGVRESHHRV